MVIVNVMFFFLFLTDNLLLVYWQVLDFVRRHVSSGTPLLAGNSVYVDLLFLKVSMNNLESFFSLSFLVQFLLILLSTFIKSNVPPRTVVHLILKSESVIKLPHFLQPRYFTLTFSLEIILI
jgi:oligoribonuclease (3'-5' exoribonuclease)